MIIERLDDAHLMIERLEGRWEMIIERQEGGWEEEDVAGRHLWCLAFNHWRMLRRTALMLFLSSLFFFSSLFFSSSFSFFPHLIPPPPSFWHFSTVRFQISPQKKRANALLILIVFFLSSSSYSSSFWCLNFEKPSTGVKSTFYLKQLYAHHEHQYTSLLIICPLRKGLL